MQTTGPGPAPGPASANAGLPINHIIGTQQARSLHLRVHADRLPNGRLNHDASVAFANQAAGDSSTLVMYSDGSGNYRNHHEPQWTGVAVAWKRRDELLYHVAGSTIPRPMESDQMEICAVNEGMSTALVERWSQVESQVVVLMDNIIALQVIRDWVPGQGGANERVLQRLKKYDDFFAAQGVPVVVRFLKGRRFVEGHDIADVWARQLSTPRESFKHSGNQTQWYHARERHMFTKIMIWHKAVDDNDELEGEWNRFERRVAQQS
ncbi:zinc knuckle protein [Diplodia corticola]|uniref:Zinc knuckle protein n=1 Tax=Diplodia corticola TaxID=236234 RepID=A0A1J9S552_9PEZI|nr:zinc knuckle protein [Diplodia corticola]OJD35076.1 zinc knuckle protein [Diplodia corticola]